MHKAELLAVVEQRCKEANLPLKEGAKNLVFGKGSAEARILFIGEAPGAHEDAQGMPFVGAAGKNLDKLLATVGLTLNDVYVANVLKYRPPENRNPLPAEIEAHAPWLLEQIRALQPTVICTLGNYATKLLLSDFSVARMDDNPGITQLHGKVHFILLAGSKVTVVPLFHPAAIIYNQRLKPLWEADMGIVKGLLPYSLPCEEQ
jgi:uracil-DNA glycosylase